MKYLNRKSNYDKFPEIAVNGFDDQAVSGYSAVIEKIKKAVPEKGCIVIECYPGVHESELLNEFVKELCPDQVLLSRNMFYAESRIKEMIQPHLTDDRVFGTMFYGSLSDFVDQKKKEEIQSCIRRDQRTLVFGFGASLITSGDLLIYADVTRWEIQLRYRTGMPNYFLNNPDEDILRKYKMGFFVEWRIADKLKQSLYDRIDFYLDTDQYSYPKMLTGEAFRAGLQQASLQPFRLVPYFDPGVWGGQWMKEVMDLDPSSENYAWSFDGVPEENSICLCYGKVKVSTPAMNLVKYCPVNLLGRANYARYGAEFPIRFDLLDTMGGQKLSLQVHPLTEYIKTMFGMTYTQDESYYILDAGKNGGVYLGLKDHVDAKQMIEDLKQAKTTGKFDADQYVNCFPAKKHDHFLIPAGTVHCSSSDCMVLEVSATPYIFTFKLWDWDRVGLDGRPRPVHVEHGEKVIQWDRTTAWVKDHLVDHFETVTKNDHYEEIKTGLHELEPIETRVSTFAGSASFDTKDTVNVLNLVDGSAAIVESPKNSWHPFEVHYAETFIIPASVGEYTIKSKNSQEEIKVLRAYIRSNA